MTPGFHPIHEGFHMIANHKIQDHPAYKRALGGGRDRVSYYLQVLGQNLHHFHDQVPLHPCEVDEQEVLRGTVFLMEEAIEYSSAKTLEDKFDALVDIVIVALGRAVFHGFHHFDEAMARVVEANLSKVPGPSPRRGEWSRDLSKPEGWQPAYLRDLVLPSYVVDLESSSDESLDENETEVLEEFKKRWVSKSTSEIEYLVHERERLIEAAGDHDEKENLSARVITNLRGKVADLTIEGDKAAFDRDTQTDLLCEVTTERDEYQRQLKDEISRCHALRGSNDNLRKRLFDTDEVAAESPRDESLTGGLIDTQTLRRVISLRDLLKSQVFSESGVMTYAERNRQRLILQAESVLTDVELHADSPMRVPFQLEYANTAGEVHETEESSIELDHVHPVLLECARLLVKKSQDYGSSLTDYSKGQYMPFGHYSYIHMMHTKMSRIRAIAIDRDRGQNVNFESLRDSVLDLINYAAFYGAWLKELEKTDVEEHSR